VTNKVTTPPTKANMPKVTILAAKLDKKRSDRSLIPEISFWKVWDWNTHSGELVGTISKEFEHSIP
jgi:hypothetical protein